MPTRKFSFAVTVALAMFVASSIMIAVRAQAQTETVLHNFGNGKDGAAPYASLTRDSAGNLYGTTFGGGHWTTGGGTDRRSSRSRRAASRSSGVRSLTRRAPGFRL